MATCTLGVSTASTGNLAATYTSGSFSPAAGDLLVAIFTGTADTVASVADSLSAHVWVKVAEVTGGTAPANQSVWIATGFASGSAMTVTATMVGQTGTGMIIQVVRIAGSFASGAAAFRQSASQNTGSAAATPAPVFSMNCKSNNPVIGVVGNGSNPAGLTQPSGWAELDDTGYNSPTTGAEMASIDSGFSGTTVTWGSTSATGFGDVVVEIEIQTALATTPNMPYTTGFLEQGAGGSLLRI